MSDFSNRVQTVITSNPSNFATASGTNTYSATINPSITAYTAGQTFNIKFTNANTGAVTINLNGLGAKAIQKNGGTALASGDIAAGEIYSIFYDGTNFQIVGRVMPIGATVASVSTLNTGTNNAQFASALGLQGSKYLDQSGAKISATATGTNAYVATITPAITAYVATQRFFIRFTNANTGAATINLNGLGVKSIVKNGIIALESGDISAGQIYCLAYDGTNFQILGKLTASGVSAKVQARRTTSFAVPNGTPTVVSFDTTEIESNSAIIDHDAANPERIYINESTYVLGFINFVFTNGAAGTRIVTVEVYINGTTLLSSIDFPVPKSESAVVTRTLIVPPLTAGDFITLRLGASNNNVTLDAKAVVQVIQSK